MPFHTKHYLEDIECIKLHNFEFMINDVLLFGREDIGFPDIIRSKCSNNVNIKIPFEIPVPSNKL